MAKNPQLTSFFILITEMRTLKHPWPKNTKIKNKYFKNNISIWQSNQITKNKSKKFSF